MKKVGFSAFLKCVIPPNRNSEMEGSLQIGILKWRDPSKSEFRNGGIAQADAQQMALLAAVSKVVNSPIFHICCKHQNSSMQLRICESLVILVKQ